MSIRKRPSKKQKSGYVFEVNFTYKENGITRRYWKSGFTTKKEAQEHEALIRAELKEKGKIKKDTLKTLDDVYQEFLDVGASQYQENTIKNTIADYHYFKDDLGHIPIKMLDYATLQGYFNKRGNYGIETNKNIRKALNRIIKYALKVGYIDNNPLSMVTVTGKENARNNEKILDQQDFLILVDALMDRNVFKYQAYAIAIQIGYYTGLRVSEVLALDKSDFDLDNDIIHVDKKLIYRGLKKKDFKTSHRMKSKKSKSLIPLPGILKDVIINWFKVNPYSKAICDVEGFYINPDVMGIDVKKVARALDISFNFHMLRHTYATMLVTNNVDLKTAQDLMRHSNINTTMSIYTHIQEKHKLDTVNSIFDKKCGENVAKTQDKQKALN